MINKRHIFGGEQVLNIICYKYLSLPHTNVEEDYEVRLSEKCRTQDVAGRKNASARFCINGNNYHNGFLT